MQCVETEGAAPKLNSGSCHRERGHGELCRGEGANAEEAPPR
jgi:hypothetical protein